MPWPPLSTAMVYQHGGSKQIFPVQSNCADIQEELKAHISWLQCKLVHKRKVANICRIYIEMFLGKKELQILICSLSWSKLSTNISRYLQLYCFRMSHFVIPAEVM